jgi:hypothetical protein
VLSTQHSTLAQVFQYRLPANHPRQRAILVLFYEYVGSKREDTMAEHIMHKKETKKQPKKTLKEKREDKKAKKKDKDK